MKTYGVVLIGCGHIGREHMADIYYRDNIRIKAVIDCDIERAEDFKRKFAAEAADTDYIPYISSSDTDIVIIAAPVSCHLSMLRDCLKYGKNVLCEKPLSENFEDGRQFYELCKNAKSHVTIGHILRYNDTFLKVRELIRGGAIGTLRTVRMVQNHHIINTQRYHELLKECSPVLDCGVHYFDLVQWITGERITSVGGFKTRISSDFTDVRTDYVLSDFAMDNGVVGYYEAGWSRSISSCNVKEFIGDKGSIAVTLNQFRSTHTEEGDLIEIYTAGDNSYRSINIPCDYKPMYRQLSALIDLIEGRASEAPSVDEAYSAFKVAVAADEAAETGRRISVIR